MLFSISNHGHLFLKMNINKTGMDRFHKIAVRYKLLTHIIRLDYILLIKKTILNNIVLI